MNDLYFVRHAATDMAGTFCGQSDPPVNAAGHRQIADLIQQLRGDGYDSVYTSDLRRAATTAAAIAAFSSIPCIERASLREIRFGQWEGLTWDEIEARDPAFARRWMKASPRLAAPGGEAITDFERRVGIEIDWLLHQPHYPRALVVTHAGVMRTVLQRRCMLSEEQAWARTRNYCSSFHLAAVTKNVAEKFHDVSVQDASHHPCEALLIKGESR